MTDGISPKQYNYIMLSNEDSPLDELLRLSASSAMLSSALGEADPFKHDSCQSLLENCIVHRETVLAWYKRRQPDIGEIEGLLFSQLPPTDGLFGPAYQFPSLHSSRLHLLFFNAMRLLHPLISQAKSLILSHIPADPLEDIDLLIESYYADQIARSIPFCLRAENRACFAHISVFLLGQISQTYTKMRSSDKFTWCQCVLDIIADLGFNFASHRKAMMLEEWAQAGLSRSISHTGSRSQIKGGMPTPTTIPTAGGQPDLFEVSDGSST